MLSIFYFSVWLILRGASYVRPSALARGYGHIWLFIIGWSILVAVTVLEDRFRISSGYFFVFFQSSIFVSTLISLLEMFALPKKTDWAQQVREDHETRDHLLTIPHNEDLMAPTPGELASPLLRDDDDDEEVQEPATETTPLVRGSRVDNARTTFTTTYRRSVSALIDKARKVKENRNKPYADEQTWSANLPSWTWFFQFLIIASFSIILASQNGLTFVDAVAQTGTDGSSLLLPYLIVAAFSILIVMPITPYIHRIAHHVPVFLLVVFTGTLIYNLVAFPFSSTSQFKLFFQQSIDLDTGVTINSYHGVEEYVRLVVSQVPSAAGQVLSCEISGRDGLRKCSYDGSSVPPVVGKPLADGIPPQKTYSDLVSLNVTRGVGKAARFEIDAVNTKTCFLNFTRPISNFDVLGGSGWDDRFGLYPELGVGLIKLWRRDQTKPWIVDVQWTYEDELQPPGAVPGLDGFLLCQWADANVAGTIPAFDEALRYIPPWAVISKYAEGLVEGRKAFKV